MPNILQLVARLADSQREGDFRALQALSADGAVQAAENSAALRDCHLLAEDRHEAFQREQHLKHSVQRSLHM